MSWLLGKKDKKPSPFEASMPLDTDEIKIVEARYNEQPVFFGVGRATDISTQVRGEVTVSELGGSGEYKKERTYQWEYWYNPSVIPGFLPLEKAKELMVGTVSLVSGAVSSVSEPKPLTGEIRVGNATINSGGVFVSGVAGGSLRASVQVKNPETA